MPCSLIATCSRSSSCFSIPRGLFLSSAGPLLLPLFPSHLHPLRGSPGLKQRSLSTLLSLCPSGLSSWMDAGALLWPLRGWHSWRQTLAGVTSSSGPADSPGCSLAPVSLFLALAHSLSHSWQVFPDSILYLRPSPSFSPMNLPLFS